MRRAGVALLALTSRAELSASSSKSFKLNDTLTRVPAMQAAMPGAIRHLWKFGFSSSSNQSQEGSKAEGEAAGTAQGDGGAAAASAAAEAAAASDEQPAGESICAEELKQAYQDLQAQLENEKKKSEDMKDKLLRTLADMENLRDRTARQTAEAKQFATQSLIKSIIDVADNLERAASAVPLDELHGDKEVDAERALSLLRSLRDGVLMTDSVLLKIMEKEGVTRYDPLGEPFDPNLHNALFEVPDATKEPGTVAVVIKKGYLMHGERAVRAADVGVAREA